MGKMLKTHLYRNRPLLLWRCRKPKLLSKPGEPEGEFIASLRDLAMEKIRKKYKKKLASLQDKIRRAEEKVDREKSQYKQQKAQTVISIGATLLGALVGRKLTSAGTMGKATTAMRGMGRSGRERGDIGRAEENLEVLNEKLEELKAEFEEGLAEVRDGFEVEDVEHEELRIAPRKSDRAVDQLLLVWTPWTVDADGIAEEAF